jgi:hypothetical protein
MRKSNNKLKVLISLALISFSLKTSAQEINLKPDFGCLSLEQKQKIAIAFEENKACHESLKLASDTEQPIKNLAIAFLVGAVLGIGATLAVHK